ncbi:SRPBCC family protein [Streptomyces sp. DSM 44917]|uniref:SRPBCC family protein n=1 Tax=Streptomyces boetiae TaxID=3075541 RepID=A0ABU2LD15_9ACTN|nr:SRPBCC family protein [Streptomyces sp. DSM 44917]MDT0309468.1 SRPBCC family protein [Streptomyces sp. DSM 44917]
MLFKDPAATGRVAVSASPEAAYRVISDPPLMAGLAAETVGARWLDGAGHAEVGARFRGYNRNGFRRWATTCEVLEADPGRRFSYFVRAPLRVPISRWQYDIAPGEDGGCVITETNWIKVPLWFIPFAILITGIANRPGANQDHIATTLERLKAHLEGAPAPA